ncbi:MAG: acyloxyacyl hydrolase [Roseobacter sp.]
MQQRLSAVGMPARQQSQMKKISCWTALLLVLSRPLEASELIVGIGVDDVDGREAETIAIEFEYHTNPLRQYGWGIVSGMFVIKADGDRDSYIGVGPSLLWNTSDKWFVEGSLTVGYYNEGNGGTNLGGNLQFRTLIGLGYRLSDRTRLSVAIDHLSNAGIEDFNPGREAVSVRYGVQF